LATHTLTAGQRGAYAKTLVAATVDTVALVGSASSVEVYSNGTAAIYFTIDGSAPTVGGGHCFEIPAGGPAVRTVRGPTATVKLISAATPTYSVSEA